ncbi:MAG: 30S ribosomal protein S6 [Candidatus Latescibacteria bacterium]|nr:30S ribosomal protein S6 [Candidatus Latescibacterota bacterium]
MRSYECAVIVHPAVNEDGLRASTAKYVDIIAKGGGEITKVETWGKRRLSYEIMKQPEGTYFFYRFRGGSALVDELGRQMRIDEGILRHLIVRDELAEGNEPALEPGTVEATMRHPEREVREEVEHRGERY